jgi:predicted RNase H-like nuclease (RuvC/YqgF family)
MKNIKVMNKLCIVILLFFLLPFSVRSQEDVVEVDQSISGTYRYLYDNSETYNAYKVFKISSMNALMKKVQDSLRINKQAIAEGKQEIVDLNNKIDILNTKIEELDQELKQTQKVAGSISLLGLLISKITYNIILWGIIGGLIVLLVIAYGSHARSLKLYNIARKEFTDLNEEFEDYRRTSQENKVKLGRELQTERNKVADLKSRLAARE